MLLLKFLRLFSLPFNIIAAQEDGGATLKLDLLKATVQDLEFLLQANQISSVQLTRLYLAQIANHTDLNAVIETAPRRLVLDIAAELDYERRIGRSRGPLHGIPVLVKDSIATDASLGMNTTAGSFALLGSQVPGDADVVKMLRKAGAIIIGKTNMSVWANFRSAFDLSSNGWSPRGGQTHSFIAPGIDPGGSSTGSAVSLSAGFAPLTLGTETHGSLIAPASRAGVYALKPSWISIKNDGVVPVARSMDTVGVMAKGVWDLAVALGAIMIDQSGKRQRGLLEAFDEGMEKGWRGLRVGVLEGGKGEIFNNTVEAVRKMESAGARVKLGVKAPAMGDEMSAYLWENFTTVTLNEFKDDITAYLQTLRNSPLRSLQDLIAYNDLHNATEMPPGHCCQEIFQSAVLSKGCSTPEYRASRVSLSNLSRNFGIDYMFSTYDVDVLVLPESEGDGATPWVLASGAGYPIATAPLSVLKNDGMPYGVVFMAKENGEEVLVRAMAAWERVIRGQKVRKGTVVGRVVMWP